jgi:hypothetical protein
MIGYHPKGRGTIHGLDAFVSHDSRLDFTSSVRGQSHVFDSVIAEGSNILNSQLSNCALWESLIVDSILCSTVAIDVQLDSVVVEDCKLNGPWHLDAPIHMRDGIWNRPPRYHIIKGENGVQVGLAESLNGFAFMACYHKPLQKWLKYGPRLGQKHGWENSQIQEARDFFTMLLDTPLPTE